jgi:para-aminobenzoate synthetase component 1
MEELTLGADFWCYAAQHRSEPFAFLLDSARILPGLGRYSFLGGAPWLVYRARRCAGSAALGLAEIELQYLDPLRPDAAPRVVRRRADLFEDLGRCLAELAMPHALRTQLALPFVGGAVGYVGYEAAHFIERLPDRAVRDVDQPELCLLFVDQLLAHDHATGITHLVTTGRGASEADALAAAELLRVSCKARIARFNGELLAADGGMKASHSGAVQPRGHVALEIRAHATEDDYVQTVERAREHILAGDAFEVCTTHRLHAAYGGDAWTLYERLREINPAPFACYLQLPGLRVVSSSPERFLRLTCDGAAEARPIKGTRPRGATPDDDARLRAELSASEKDRAENIMIVDLVRNDLGRVCEVDSIHVPELMVIEDHPSVFHMVSTVRGQLSAEHTPLALFRACFPPGSMTGAPKIEAMKIIDALEPYQRGIYAGSLGYFDLGGGMDWSVVIRSFVLQEGRCYFGVGGAVVADSDPRAEYRESMAKAQALLRALELSVRAPAGASP